MNQLVATPPNSELKKIGRQMEDLYRKTQTGLLSCIALGDLVAQARKVVSTVDTTPGGPNRGPQTKGDGLKAVLTEIAPNVPRSTAYRYEELAENVREEMKLGAKVQLAQIITGEVKTDKAAALLEKLTAFVSGKTQRQLLLEIGTPDAQVGGKRTKAKKLTPEQEQAEWIAAATQTAKSTANAIRSIEERWKLLTDVELNLAVEAAEAFAKEARAWLKTPQPSRVAIDAAKYLAAEEEKAS